VYNSDLDAWQSLLKPIERQFKNIADPIHAFKVGLDAPTGSLIDYDSPVLPAANQITTESARGTALRTLFFVTGGLAALVIVLGIFLMSAEPPNGLPAAQVPTLTLQSRLTQEDTAVTQIIKPSPTNALLPGVSFRDCNFCPEMVVVPTGKFLMGSDKSHAADAPPVEITIAKPFALSRFEITFDDWEACAKGGGCGTYIPDDSGWGRGKQPVINISWKDAQAYVVWLSERTSKTYRLPSEAEWEYAARAGSIKRFPWGRVINPAIANYGYFNERAFPVGSFNANAFGLYDVIGNVAEWVSDCYAKNSYNSHVHYPAPVGNLDDTCKRVLRGASWASRADPSKIRTSTRWSGSTNGRYNFNGVRVLRVVE
jgi:formylglycine-generating enzyme required for sulfatase activity